MIKFYVQSQLVGATITRVEVARETDMFVVLEGERTAWGGKKEKWTRREAKKNAYFDSWKEAHEFLLRQYRDRLESANLQAQSALAHLDRVQAMKEDAQ